MDADPAADRGRLPPTLAAARWVCAHCPLAVAKACLAEAMADEHGASTRATVRGGLSAPNRATLAAAMAADGIATDRPSRPRAGAYAAAIADVRSRVRPDQRLDA